MKKIKLTKGKYALVDDDMFEYLNQFKWYYNSTGYAVRTVKGKKVLMHRIINNTPSSFETDHINRNKLDNRRKNLRTVTQGENNFNRDLYRSNKSGYRGIFWEKSRKCWEASIVINSKKIHLGRFKVLKVAREARKQGEEVYHVKYNAKYMHSRP